MKKNKIKDKQPGKAPAKSAQTPDAPTPKNKYGSAMGLAGIILLGILIYSNSFDCTFHFDDIPNIVDNPAIRNLADVQSWWNANPNRAVSFFTFALNYHFHQFDVRYWHYFNLGVHLMNACLVWWLVGLLFATPALQDAPVRRYRKEIAFFTALLFVSHPLATQSVTYIVQRMASMAAMFYLLSLALYLKGRLTHTPSKYRFFAGALLSAVLAVFTKENAFTLPLALVLVEICFLQTRKFSFDLRDYRLLLPLAALLCIFLVIPLKFSFRIFDPILPAHGNTYTVTPVNYLFTQFSVIVKYLQLLLVPIGQNLEHDFPIAQSFFEIRTLLSFSLLVAFVGLAVYLFNKNRILAFGIFWFFITLAVESSFLPIEDLIFEHRTYLPAVGFFLFLTTGAYQLFRTNSPNLVMGILLLFAGANAVLTYQRNKVWKDDYTLLQDIISKSPNKARPHVNLGSLYMDRAQWDKALPYFSKAIEINPGFFDAYNNRAAAWYNMQQWANSIADYSKALEIKPESAKLHYSRAIAYNNLGQADKALTDFNRTIELDAQNALAYGKRGLLFDKSNQLDKALADYSSAIELDPKYAEAFSNRGITYGKLGQWQKSIDDFNQAIAIDPNLKVAYSNREISLQNLKIK